MKKIVPVLGLISAWLLVGGPGGSNSILFGAPPAGAASPSSGPVPAAMPASAPDTLTLKLSDRVTMILKLIPAGKFMMGSPKEEQDRWDNEGPQREVTISKSFYVGVYEVTHQQYSAIMGADPRHPYDSTKPVDQVSWHDAVEFCKKASEKTGKKVRLPTEAEWEYACRAGTKTRFSFGDDEKGLDDYGWYEGNSVKIASNGEKQGGAHPVGQKKPNAFGLYDVHGNVWEWCSDWYWHNYENAPDKDPPGPKSGVYRVIRGGAWYRGPLFSRSACRDSLTPDFCHDGLGFRVVVSTAGAD